MDRCIDMYICTYIYICVYVYVQYIYIYTINIIYLSILTEPYRAQTDQRKWPTSNWLYVLRGLGAGKQDRRIGWKSGSCAERLQETMVFNTQIGSKWSKYGGPENVTHWTKFWEGSKPLSLIDGPALIFNLTSTICVCPVLATLASKIVTLATQAALQGELTGW